MDDEYFNELSEFLPKGITTPPPDGIVALARLMSEFRERYKSAKSQSDKLLEGKALFRDVHCVIDAYDLSVGFETVISKSATPGDRIDKTHEFADEVEAYIKTEAMRKLAQENAGLSIDRISLTEDAKNEIRALVEKIKTTIDKAKIEERKKDQLFAKLNAFLKAVDSSNTSLGSFLAAKLQIAKATGEAAKELEPAVGLFERITKAIGRGSGDTPSLPPWEEKKQIEGPPKQIEDHRDSASSEEEVE